MILTKILKKNGNKKQQTYLLDNESWKGVFWNCFQRLIVYINKHWKRNALFENTLLLLDELKSGFNWNESIWSNH